MERTCTATACGSARPATATTSFVDLSRHQTFEYIYNIPSDHPAGTFWYHSHRHGSTALQVSSGMAGAIIIRGNRLPTPNKHGDIDTLLKQAGGTAMPSSVLVMQQIQYGCLRRDGNIKVRTVPAPTPTDPGRKIVAWVCDPGDVGTVGPYMGSDGQLGYDDKNGNGYGPGNWAQSGRYTSINGVVLPTFTAHAGQMQPLAHDPWRRARHDQPAILPDEAERQAQGPGRGRQRLLHPRQLRRRSYSLLRHRRRRPHHGQRETHHRHHLPARLSLRRAGDVPRRRRLLRGRCVLASRLQRRPRRRARPAPRQGACRRRHAGHQHRYGGEAPAHRRRDAQHAAQRPRPGRRRPAERAEAHQLRAASRRRRRRGHRPPGADLLHRHGKTPRSFEVGDLDTYAPRPTTWPASTAR